MPERQSVMTIGMELECSEEIDSNFFSLGRVAAGAIADQYLSQVFGVEITAFVSSVGRVEMPFLDQSLTWPDRCKHLFDSVEGLTRRIVDGNIVRCPDVQVAEQMIKASRFQLYVY